MKRERLIVMLVSDLMSSPVISLHADQTFPHARELMRFKHVRHLPVVDAAQRLVGLVTHRDILRWADMSAEIRRDGRDELRVAHMMTTDVWAVPPEMRASLVGHMMLERRHGCAPVIDASRRLVGIVTATDFLRLAVDALDALPVARFVTKPAATPTSTS